MDSFVSLRIPPELAWSFTLMLSWLCGEYVQRWTNIPRICIYGVVGFVFGAHQMGILPSGNNEAMLLLANIAFGLILFEVGYRINLRWFRINYWMSVSGVVEALLTFTAIYTLLLLWEIDNTTAMLMAALAMSTSPASVIRVINEQRSSGQVTERIIHLSALSCVLAALSFKAMVGLHVFQSSGNIWQATYSSVVILLVSSFAGLCAGMVMPVILRKVVRPVDGVSGEGTLAFALAVILLVTLMHTLKGSPIIAALVFGITARHRRLVLSQTSRNFGALGDLLSVLLFTFVASTLQWPHVQAGIGLALCVIVVRLASKVIGATVFAQASGISWQKGIWTGVAMSPISVFVILTLEQTRYLGIDLADELMMLAAVTLMLEILGPVLTQRALRWAGECPESKEKQHVP